MTTSANCAATRAVSSSLASSTTISSHWRRDSRLATRASRHRQSGPAELCAGTMTDRNGVRGVTAATWLGSTGLRRLLRRIAARGVQKLVEEGGLHRPVVVAQNDDVSARVANAVRAQLGGARTSRRTDVAHERMPRQALL